MKRVEVILALALLCVLVCLEIFRTPLEEGLARLESGQEESEEESSDGQMGSEESMVPDGQESQAGQDSSEANESSAIEPLVYRPGDPLSVSEVTYLDDAVFIGDSRTQGLQLGTGLTAPRFLAERGLSVDKVKSEVLFELPSGGYGTVYDVLAEQSFGKAYLMFGVNELGWVYVDGFIDEFREVIHNIKELQPNIVIYVQGILPVTEEKSQDGDVYTNEKIQEWNPKIQQMAEEEGCVYLNPGEAFWNENKALPEDASADGIHLTGEYCQKWLDYLLSHTWTGGSEPAGE